MRSIESEVGMLKCQECDGEGVVIGGPPDPVTGAGGEDEGVLLRCEPCEGRGKIPAPAVGP